MLFFRRLVVFIVGIVAVAGLWVPALAQQGAGTITIGENTILPNGDNGNGNLLVAQNATLSQPAIIQSLSFYVTTAGGSLRLGIYDATGPGGGPGALKAQTNSFTPVVGWNTQPVITPVSLPAGTYWLAYLPQSNTLAFRKNEVSGTSGRYYSYTFGALPATFSTAPSTTPSHWSLYATFNGGGGTSGGGGTITIGENTILPNGDNGNGNLLVAQNATLSQPAIIQSLSFYVTTAGGSLRLGIYDATGPGGGPGALKAQTNSFTPVVGWNTQPVITPVSLPAGTYWLAYLPQSNTLAFRKNESFRHERQILQLHFRRIARHVLDCALYHSVTLVPLRDAQRRSFGHHRALHSQNLTATATSSSQVNLTWTASTDNVGVTGYRVFRNGMQKATTSATSYIDTGLTASTTYTYAVSAYDAAMNSAQSSSVGVITLAAGGGGGGGGGGPSVAAASCSQTNVQSAINSAPDGATVLVPSGSCNWSGTVNLPMTKGVSVVCQGTCTISGSGTKFG